MAEQAANEYSQSELRAPVLLVEADQLGNLDAETLHVVMDSVARIIRSYVGGSAVRVALGERVIGSQELDETARDEGRVHLLRRLEDRRVDDLELSQGALGERLGRVGRGISVRRAATVSGYLSRPFEVPGIRLLEVAAALETRVDFVLVSSDRTVTVQETSNEI